MKKVLLQGMVAASVGFACYAQAAEEVTVWAWDPNFNVAIMEEAAARYEAAHPGVDIKVVDFAKDDIEKKLHTMLASGVTSSLPDVVLIEDYNAQKYLLSYPGSFAPMTSAVDYSKFAPYKVDVMTVNGEVYGLPFDTGVTGMYYRSDLLKEAGYSEKDLENITWDKFIEIGKAVKAKTGKYMLGNNPSDLGLLRVMLQSTGQWYFKPDGSLNISDNKGLSESLRVYRDLHTAGIVLPTVGWSEWVGSANNGSVASITTGVWITASVKAGENQQGKWMLAPTPRIDIKGGVNSSNLGGSSWYVMSTSKEKEQAINFLKETFGSDVDFYQEILKKQGAVGSFIPAGQTPAYQFEDTFFNNQRIYAKFNKWATEIPAVNYGMYTYEVDAALAAQMPSIIQGAPINKVLASVEQQLKYQIQ